ncbi:MAG: hypothetical protein AAB723_00440 [Patescibacteria group bacterium]
MVEKRFSLSNEKVVPEPDKQEKVFFGFLLQAFFCEKEGASPQEVSIQIEQRHSRFFINGQEIKSTSGGSPGQGISFYVDGGGRYVCQLGPEEGRLSLENYQKFLKIFRGLSDGWPSTRF